MGYQILLSNAAIFLCLPGCIYEPRPTRLKPGVTFEVYTVAAKSSPNTKSLTDPATMSVLNLVTPPVVTAANIRDATVTIDENNHVSFSVNIDEPSAPSAARLESATAVFGTKLAIVINGEITAVPSVVAPTSSPFHVSGGSLSAGYWEELVE